MDVPLLNRDELAEIRNQKIGFIFQGLIPLARTAAVENVELPMLYRHQKISGANAARARYVAEIVGLAQRAGIFPASFPAATTTRGHRPLVGESAGALLADEPTAISTRKRASRSWRVPKLNAQGITIMMVTHELDIAQYTKRTVVLRDGLSWATRWWQIA